MKTSAKLIALLLLLVIALGLSGCGGYSSSSVRGSAGYDLYDGYRYPYRYGYHNDVDVYVRRDRDDVRERREQFHDKRPETRQRVESARSRAGSMGRPVRGGRIGRR